MSLLARKQEDLSAFDVSNYFQDFHGPPEALELILSMCPPLYDIGPQYDDVGHPYPMLAAALKNYAEDPATWEPILRALIRRRIGLHAPVRRDPEDVKQTGYPCLLSEYGTPLDELFACNRDPEVAKTVADSWLQILASEDCDVSRYLKNEITSHSQDMSFTHPSMSAIGYDIPRQLVFELGKHPNVSWIWWFDPACPIFRLREEFKCLVTTLPDMLRIAKPWKEHWPFVFPKWAYSLSKALRDLAEDRAIRRVGKKAAKLTRPQRSTRAQSAPGAWVD